jgi:rhamnosyltransferase
MANTYKVSLLIPTLNAGKDWPKALESIQAQSLSPMHKIIIDSGSTDETVPLAASAGFDVIKIGKKEFNHGTARQTLADRSHDADICIFLTQDAVLASPGSILNLVNVFEDPQIGLAYGRQLPHHNARPLEAHARLFNYHERHEVRAYSDKQKLGFKVVFCSNSFAAYRKEVLNQVGGFPSDSIMGEDAIVSARMLLAGHKVAYVADAMVYHSHSYSFKEEFKRYFDTRVFHEQNKWLIDNYGRPTGEGLRYVKSEVNYVIRNHPQSLLHVVGSTFAKWLGYSSGKYYKKVPKNLLKKLSMHSSYWE